MNEPNSSLKFARPLWRGFVIAPIVTALSYIAIQVLLSVAGITEYKGPPDEEYYLTYPPIVAFNFIVLSLFACMNAFLCGLPLIRLLARMGRLSLLTLILGATILGLAVLPIEVPILNLLLDGTITDWKSVMIWAAGVGAASGGFTAIVFVAVVGVTRRNGISALSGH